MKRFSALFSVLLAFVFCAFSAGAISSPALSAKHACLLDAVTGDVLFEKDADTPAPMASTTKIMTAIAVIEALPLDKEIEIPAEAVGTEGTSAYFKEGERLTVRDLLYALMLSSANDAAVTLAIACDGSVSLFAERMNRLARELSLQSTHFENPHGLPADGHYTTAKELALIAAYAMKNPVFAEIVGKKSYTCKTSLCTRTFQNHNKLLSFSKDAIGVKTGFTKASGRCLVGAAERDGALLISVTLSAPNDWNDHISLFHYGFSLLGVPENTKG